MNFEALPWHFRWIEDHRDTVRTRHHAWMLVGREDDGLQQAGAALAASLLCEAPREGRACGECGSCRWIANDVHPDFVRLAPEEADDEVLRLPTIKTDAARAAISVMELSASTERGRVILIDPATALTRESANALLKAIEEPPPNTRWILLAARPAKLLPTIRSRALKLNLPRPSEQAALSWLDSQGVAREKGRTLLALTQGSPLAALALADGENTDIRERFFRDLGNPRELPTLAWGGWVDAGGKSGRRARFALLLHLLLQWTSAWARLRSELAADVGAEMSGLASRVAPKLALSEGVRFYRELLRKLWLPDTTLSARLQIEAILLEYRSKFS